MNTAMIKREQVVLAYHKIGASPDPDFDTWHFIPEPDFRSQLEWIDSSDWQVIDLRTFILGLSTPDQLPPKSMLITFDDGHLSMRQTALPILLEFGFPAVCFVPTGHIGKESIFDHGVEPIEHICDWDDLRTLQAAGIAIQSHGVSHHWFSLLNSQELRWEIVNSKLTLEQGLDEKVVTLAYPYSDMGGDDSDVGTILKENGYCAAFLCGGGPNKMKLPLANPYMIDRLAVYRDTQLEAIFT